MRALTRWHRDEQGATDSEKQQLLEKTLGYSQTDQ